MPLEDPKTSEGPGFTCKSGKTPVRFEFLNLAGLKKKKKIWQVCWEGVRPWVGALKNVESCILLHPLGLQEYPLLPHQPGASLGRRPGGPMGLAAF